MRFKKESKTWDYYALYFEVDTGEDYDRVNRLVCYTFKNIYAITFDREWIKPLSVKRMNTYSNTMMTELFERRFGFSLSDGNFLQIYYGAQETGWNDKVTEKRKSWFLPWKMWKHRYHHLLNLDGTLFLDVTKLNGWEYKNEQPKNVYVFNDFDGEEIYATATMEQRMWTRGEGMFKWLKYFYPKKVSTDLDLEFSSEVGKRKGSWKGGTLGHGIELLDESPDEAFQRYCRENNLQYIRKLDDIEAAEWYQNMLDEKEKRYQQSKLKEAKAETTRREK